jgi:hypothetical protein
VREAPLSSIVPRAAHPHRGGCCFDKAVGLGALTRASWHLWRIFLCTAQTGSSVPVARKCDLSTAKTSSAYGIPAQPVAFSATKVDVIGLQTQEPAIPAHPQPARGELALTDEFHLEDPNMRTAEIDIVVDWESSRP